tara:strand:+ start:13345 stop:14934 length:1590 start_codon:yes stop_codon:yes gene_type:complete
MYSGVAAAGERIGSAVAGIGDKAMNFAIQKQEHVNKGILAKEETLRMKVVEDIQRERLKNQDRPEEWDKLTAEHWKNYESLRASTAKREGWSKRVIEADALAGEEFKTRTGVSLRVDQDKAQISKANSHLEMNAEARLRAGDYDGFVKSYDEMDLDPASRERKIRQGLEQGLYKVANNQLDAIAELPPAQAKVAYNEYIAKVTEKNREGNYVNYEEERGGMSLGGRVNLESIARARIKAAQREMDSESRKIIAGLRTGLYTEANIDAAVKAGDIDQATAEAMSPLFKFASEENKTKEEQKQQVIEDKKLAAEDKQLAKAASIGGNIDKGAVGEFEIEQQWARGKITREQADQLKVDLAFTASGEQRVENGEYSKINDKINLQYSKNIFQGGAEQPDDNTYTKILTSIKDAKLTKATRLKLVDKLMLLKLADVADLQEEGPTGRWTDRDISPQEKQTRVGLIDSYRQVLPVIGPELAGDLLFEQETLIRNFFDIKSDRSQSEIDAFVTKQLLPSLFNAAAQESLEQAFNY